MFERYDRTDIALLTMTHRLETRNTEEAVIIDVVAEALRRKFSLISCTFPTVSDILNECRKLGAISAYLTLPLVNDAAALSGPPCFDLIVFENLTGSIHLRL